VAISSPYAVFKAADLGWQAAPAAPAPRAVKLLSAHVVQARPAQAAGGRPQQRLAMVQGELFQLA